MEAGNILAREKLKNDGRRPLVVVLTDGRYTAGPDPREAAEKLRGLGTSAVVVDTESGNVRLGMAGEVAAVLGARCLKLEDLRSEALAAVVERRRVA